MIYSNEHVESYAPAKWDIKLITKRNGVIVARENISSANDKDGKRDRQLKVIKMFVRRKSVSRWFLSSRCLVY